MNNEIMEAIKKTLPTMQVEALKIELDKASRLPSVQKDLDSCREQISKLLSELNALRALEIYKNDLDKKSQAMEVEILKIKLCAESDKNAIIKELMFAAFRNPTIHKSFNKMIAVPAGGHTNNVTDHETTEVE